MRKYRWVAIVLLALCLFVQVSTSPGASAQVDHEPEDGPESTYGDDIPNVLTWNIWQGVHWGGALAPSQKYRNRVTNSRRLPMAVAAQEMCLTGFNQMRSDLASRGYSSAWYASNPNASSGCVEHGNGLFWRGGCQGVWQCILSGPFGYQFPYRYDENDTRGYVCASSLNLGFISCSAHMTNKQIYSAIQQSDEYRDIAEYFGVGIGIETFAMGDFNLNAPDIGELNPWYIHHREADPCANNNRVDCVKTHDATGTFNKKIDYIFATKGTGRCSRARPPSFYTNDYYSDHRIIRGYFNCT